MLRPTYILYTEPADCSYCPVHLNCILQKPIDREGLFRRTHGAIFCCTHCGTLGFRRYDEAEKGLFHICLQLRFGLWHEGRASSLNKTLELALWGEKGTFLQGMTLSTLPYSCCTHPDVMAADPHILHRYTANVLRRESPQTLKAYVLKHLSFAKEGFDCSGVLLACPDITAQRIIRI